MRHSHRQPAHSGVLCREMPFKPLLIKPRGCLQFRLRHSKGFTLVEMIVVMAIIALGVSMVAPSFTSGVKSAKLKSACRKAGALMHRARSDAAAYKQTMAASIDRETQRLAVEPFTGAQEDAKKESSPGISISYPLPEGVHIEEVRIGQEESEDDAILSVIFFYPDGRSSGGEIFFKDDQGRSLSLFVDRITGGAEIREPQEGNRR